MVLAGTCAKQKKLARTVVRRASYLVDVVSGAKHKGKEDLAKWYWY